MGNNINKDQNFLSTVSDILEHDEFLKTKDIVHHGMNRYDHSVKVAYYSYKMAKVFNLDEKEVARGALLHDFFLENQGELSFIEKQKLIVSHPKNAYENAAKYFDINEKQKDMILSHMWPFSPRIPRYLESWIVDLADDYVSINERVKVTSSSLVVATNFLLLLYINCFSYANIFSVLKYFK